MTDSAALKPRRRRFPFVARILTAMMLGVLAGLWLGPAAAPLGQIGTVIIDLIKGLAGPLLFFAVVDAFLRTEIRARSGLIMIAITATNAALAILIGLTLSNLFRPGDHLTITGTGPNTAAAAVAVGTEKIDFWREIAGYVPTSVVQPFVKNSIITIII